MKDKTQEAPKKSIVLLEDNRTLCGALTERLERTFQDYNIFSHYGGENCVDKITTVCKLDNINLVITDGHLVGTTGWELAKELRQRGYQKQIIYYGCSTVPSDATHLFNYQIDKSDWLGLIDLVGRCLNE